MTRFLNGVGTPNNEGGSLYTSNVNGLTLEELRTSLNERFGGRYRITQDTLGHQNTEDGAMKAKGIYIKLADGSFGRLHKLIAIDPIRPAERSIVVDWLESLGYFESVDMGGGGLICSKCKNDPYEHFENIYTRSPYGVELVEDHPDTIYTNRLAEAKKQRNIKFSRSESDKEYMGRPQYSGIAKPNLRTIREE